MKISPIVLKASFLTVLFLNTMNGHSAVSVPATMNMLSRRNQLNGKRETVGLGWHTRQSEVEEAAGILLLLGQGDNDSEDHENEQAVSNQFLIEPTGHLLQTPTYQQGGILDDKFFTILAKEGRLLKPHQLGVSKEEEAAQEQTFLYEPLGDAGQGSMKLVVRDYQLPGIETGGPGIAPVATLVETIVATVKENGLAILTNKITGDYAFIPRTKDGGSWKKKQNTGYAQFIKGLQTEYPVNVEDSVMAFVPNWIKPSQFFILYEDKTTAIPNDKTGKNHLNYKCLQYQFEDEEYPGNGAGTKGFKDCAYALPGRGRYVQPKVKAATGSLRQEIAAAVSEDQAFFYFRHTSQPSTTKPIYQTQKDNGRWEIAVQDDRKSRVMQLRQSKLTNIYVEKRNEDLNMFVAGIMPRLDPSNAKPVKAYFKNCSVSNLETIPKYKYCRCLSLDIHNTGSHQCKELKDQPFNFPLTYYPSVKDNDAAPPAKKQRVARR